MNVGLVLALASAVAYGTADFVGGIASRRASAWSVVLVGQATGAVALASAGSFTPGRPSAADIAWAILAGVGSASGGLFLFRGLARSRMGLVAPISAVGASIIPVVVGLGLGERPGAWAWLGMLAALPGIWLISRPGTSEGAGSVGGALVDGGLAGAGFAILFIALAQISPEAGLLPLVANQIVAAGLTVAVAAGLRQPLRPSRGAIVLGCTSGLIGASGTVAFVLATGAIALGIASVLASLYPAVTVLLAAALLRERMRLAQTTGMAVCLVAVAALALD